MWLALAVLGEWALRRLGGHGWPGGLLEQNTPSPMRLSRARGCSWLEGESSGPCQLLLTTVGGGHVLGEQEGEEGRGAVRRRFWGGGAVSAV